MLVLSVPPTNCEDTYLLEVVQRRATLRPNNMCLVRFPWHTIKSWIVCQAWLFVSLHSPGHSPQWFHSFLNYCTHNTVPTCSHSFPLVPPPSMINAGRNSVCMWMLCLKASSNWRVENWKLHLISPCCL